MVSFVSARVRAVLALGAFALSLPGCMRDLQNQPPDNSPPDYTIPKLVKSQGKWRYGVTDTIALEFNERIDTAALSILVMPPQSIGYRFDGASRLLVFGRRQDAGASHFPVNTPFALDMSGLRDLSGNGMGRTTEYFQPYWWSDRDFIDSAFQGFDSLFRDDSTWADSSRMFKDTFVTEGALDFNGNGNREDRQDFKLIRLAPPDSLRITVSCAKSLALRMQIAGPFPDGSQDSIFANYSFPGGKLTFYADTNKTRGTLGYQLVADPNRHYDVLGSLAAPGLYVVRLSIPEDQEGFYRIEAVARHKIRSEGLP